MARALPDRSLCSSGAEPDSTDARRGANRHMGGDPVDRSVVQSYAAVRARGAEWIGEACTAATVQGDLTVEDFTAEPFPAAIFSPGLFPGLF